MARHNNYIMVFIMALVFMLQATVVLSATINPSADQYKGTDPAKIFARDCWYERQEFGCSNDFCWKKCGGHGEWCWTTLIQNPNAGAAHCLADFQCNPSRAFNCLEGNCKQCGCSC